MLSKGIWICTLLLIVAIGHPKHEIVSFGCTNHYNNLKVLSFLGRPSAEGSG